MPAIFLAKGSNGVAALGSNGEVQKISSASALSEIEHLVKDRQAAGVKLTEALKKHGFNSLSDDEPTEIIET